jgi:hypothetical protein
VKYAWIAEQGLRYPLMDMCKVLDVSVSGYRAWKRGGRPDRKRLTDGQLLIAGYKDVPVAVIARAQ